MNHQGNYATPILNLTIKMDILKTIKQAYDDDKETVIN